MVDRETVTLDREVAERARDRARRTGRLHNLAREVFAREVVEALAGQVAAAIGTDPYADDPLGGEDAPGDPMILGAADLADIRRELTADAGVQAALDWLWPMLTPQRLLAELFASDERLAAAGRRRRAACAGEPDGARGRRPTCRCWTRPPNCSARTRRPPPWRDEAERVRRSELAYAEGALEIARGSASIDVEDEAEPELLLGHRPAGRRPAGRAPGATRPG